MKKYQENDIIRLRESVIANVIGQDRALPVSEGAEGSVVLVHGTPERPVAYEVEFYIRDQDCYAIATIEADRI